MDIKEIMTLIQAVSDSTLTSFELEEGNMKISLKREKEMPQVITVSGNGHGGMAVDGTQIGAAVSGAADSADVNTMMQSQQAGVPDIGSDKVVVSPLVGTFYASASPEADAFVKVGDTVKKGQVLGIIEAMKLMNEIESEYDGVIDAVLVQNEAVVEYGQPLFRIR